MTDNAALMRELKRRLDAQAQRHEELMAELRQLHGQGDGPPDGAATINDAIRRAAGQRTAPAAEEGADGASTINDAIRAAAGRPAAPKEGT